VQSDAHAYGFSSYGNAYGDRPDGYTNGFSPDRNPHGNRNIDSHSHRDTYSYRYGYANFDRQTYAYTAD
jgi:hypothetical protein